jgi:hypothetical protein
MTMPIVPPPLGLPPGIGLGFDWLTLVGTVTALVMLAGLAVLLWAARLRGGPARVRRPVHRADAVIEIRTSPRRGRTDPRRRALGEPRTRARRAKANLRRVG